MIVEWWWWWCKVIHFLDEIWTLSTPIFSISRTSSRQWPRNVKIKPRKNRSRPEWLHQQFSVVGHTFLSLPLCPKKGYVSNSCVKVLSLLLLPPCYMTHGFVLRHPRNISGSTSMKKIRPIYFLVKWDASFREMRTQTPFSSVNIWTKMYLFFKRRSPPVGFLPSGSSPFRS